VIENEREENSERHYIYGGNRKTAGFEGSQAVPVAGLL
jgi:hypothetical protein